MRLIAYTGLRISELAALEAATVSPARATIGVADTASESGGRREHRKEEGKTRSAVRHLVIVDQAMPAIRRLNAIRLRGAQLEPEREARRQARGVKRGPNRPLEERWTLLVSGEQGGFISYGHWRKKLDVARELSSSSYDTHALRHVCASIMWAAGMERDTIREQMGHSTLNTFERVYRHMLVVDRSEMARRISSGIETLSEVELDEKDLNEDGW